MPLPNGKTVEWPEPEYADVPDSLCWLCGGETHGRGRRHKDVIRKTFTNTNYARAITSESICVACSWILDQRFIRNWSLLVVDGRFEHPARDRVREIVTNPPTTYPWLLSIAVSGQKHISFPGHVVRSVKDAQVLLEQVPVKLPPEGIGEVLEPVEMLYTGGFSKAEIQSGQYRQDRIIRFGLSKWRGCEELIAPLRGSQLFELAVFVSQKREEESWSLDSIQRIETLQQRPLSSTQSTEAETPGESKSHRTSGESSSEQPGQQPKGQQLSLFG